MIMKAITRTLGIGKALVLAVVSTTVEAEAQRRPPERVGTSWSGLPSGR